VWFRHRERTDWGGGVGPREGVPPGEGRKGYMGDTVLRGVGKPKHSWNKSILERVRPWGGVVDARGKTGRSARASTKLKKRTLGWCIKCVPPNWRGA